MAREYLAKPSGITLKEHTENVIKEAKTIIDSYPFFFTKYGKLLNADLKTRLLVSCKYHDLGKCHNRWQEACWKDFLVYLEWKKNQKGGAYQTYQEYEKCVGSNAGKNLRKAALRHEIFSLILASDKISLPIQIAIAAHHRKLSFKSERRWREDFFGEESKKANRLFDEFIALNDDLESFEEALKKLYEFSAVRSLLILADHRASRKEACGSVPIFRSFNYTFPEEWDRRPVQKIAEENWQDDLLLIRAPTGAGKTDAAFLWAKKQIENGRADRLIISMPTRFTSNALAIETTEKLSQTGLYHSTAQFSELYKQTESEKDLHEFSRQLLTPCTVCTIDHLLIAMTLMREDHHAIAFNLANSCVVIDEADFYDEFTQANIMILLRALKEWQVPVMIMSASLPEASLELYKQNGFNVSQIREDTSDNLRKRCKVEKIILYEKVEELDELLTKCIKKGCAIIYANTVAKAIEFHEWFEKKGIKPILYHSRFTEPHKKKKENELIKALGKEAWGKGTAKGIAILTQIGEMSVNISADIMISDVCPIDRLVQRAGRLCRFDESIKKLGALYILCPQKSNKDYPAPYGIFDKGEKNWIPNKTYSKTLEMLSCKAYSASDFVNFINIIYPKIEDYEFKAAHNAEQLKQHFLFNWIMTPNKKIKEDEEQTDFWKSRDIENNILLFVTRPEDYYPDYYSFQVFKTHNAISIHPYMLIKGMKKFQTISLCNITIGNNNTEHVYFLTNSDACYSKERGLIIDQEVDQFL